MSPATSTLKRLIAEGFMSERGLVTAPEVAANDFQHPTASIRDLRAAYQQGKCARRDRNATPPNGPRGVTSAWEAGYRGQEWAGAATYYGESVTKVISALEEEASASAEFLKVYREEFDRSPPEVQQSIRRDPNGPVAKSFLRDVKRLLRSLVTSA